MQTNELDFNFTIDKSEMNHLKRKGLFRSFIYVPVVFGGLAAAFISFSDATINQIKAFCAPVLPGITDWSNSLVTFLSSFLIGFAGGLLLSLFSLIRKKLKKAKEPKEISMKISEDGFNLKQGKSTIQIGWDGFDELRFKSTGKYFLYIFNKNKLFSLIPVRILNEKNLSIEDFASQVLAFAPAKSQLKDVSRPSSYEYILKVAN